jgi:hypothetical protein
MSLPTLAELPAILLPYASRAEQSFRDAVAALDDDHGLSAWTPQRWADFVRVCAASDFVIEQSVRDPLMLLELVAWGELDRGFAPGELCSQIAGAVQQAETEDELGRVLRRQRTRQQVRIIWRDLTRQADLVQTCRDLSDMADACIDQAYQWLYQRHCVQFGTPTGRRSGEAQHMVILGMGKLGAVELNLSSDIDLIFAYPEGGETVGVKRALDNQVMFYKEDKKGQILEEGINEAGAMSSFIAAGTSYSSHNQPMLPFYIFYSMFGFQRIGDLAWAAGDSRTRGFLIGGTAGRTTLNGEGLQHEDGHSHILAATIPNCRTFDPTYGYELAVIIQDGMKKMTEEQQDVFYYITVMNESYQQPAMPAGVEEGIIKGMYLLEEDTKEAAHHVQLMGSGTILREVREAAKILREEFNVGADVWSVTSFNELRRDGLAVERNNRLHPGQKPAKSYVEECLAGRKGPVIASTDYMKLFAEQIRQWVPSKEFKVLGTDGFGRSDSRKKLRHFFEVDRHFVVLAALEALADRGEIEPKVVADAIVKFGINPEKRNPLDC